METSKDLFNIVHGIGEFAWLAIEGLYPISILIFIISIWQWYVAFKVGKKAPQYTNLIEIKEFRVAILTTFLAFVLFVLGYVSYFTGFTLWMREVFHGSTTL